MLTSGRRPEVTYVIQAVIETSKLWSLQTGGRSSEVVVTWQTLELHRHMVTLQAPASDPVDSK